MINFIWGGFRRRGLRYLIRNLESAMGDARLAAIKLRMAENMLKETRREGVDRLLLQTAMAGFPLPTNLVANMYIKSAIDSAKKACRKVRKVSESLKDHYPHIYVGGTGGTLNSALSILEGIATLRKVSINELPERAGEAEEAASMLAQVINELRSTASLHGE